MEINEALITEVVVIIQEQKEKTERENRKNGRQKNPSKRDDDISCCNICESISHWFAYCPEKRNEAEISLLSNDIQECCMAEFVTLFRIGLFAAAHK